MFCFKRIVLTSCLIIFQFKATASFRATINVLTTMHTLDPMLVDEFQKETKSNVRVDFVGSRGEFETHLKSGLRTYDVVIADERILEKLYLEKLLRSLPDDMRQKNINLLPLYVKSKMNEDGESYLPLYADPLGIAYSIDNSQMPKVIDWDILIETQLNPYWRQRIYLFPSFKDQFLIALLATKKTITSSSWFIPEVTTQWFKQLKLQNANTDLPLELAFLGNKISAAVIFYSDYLKLKRIVSNLNFVIPNQSTYFDRTSIGWSSNSPQEGLAKKFIEFIYKKRDVLAKSKKMLSLNTLKYLESDTHNWVLYEDDIPLPKRIENILTDLMQTPNKPSVD